MILLHRVPYKHRNDPNKGSGIYLFLMLSLALSILPCRDELVLFYSCYYVRGHISPTTSCSLAHARSPRKSHFGTCSVTLEMVRVVRLNTQYLHGPVRLAVGPDTVA